MRGGKPTSFTQRLLLALLGYEMIEGVVRRFFSGESKEILIGKNVFILAIYVVAIAEFGPRLTRAVERFDNAFLLGLFSFAGVAIIRMVGSPASASAMVVSFSTYFLFFPILFISYYCAQISDDPGALWKQLRPLVYLVAAYGILQALTGFDTAAVEGADDALSGAGGFYRQAGGETVLVIGSTLYGGRLASFGALWVFISFGLLLVDLVRGRKFRYLSAAPIAASFVCIALGQNRTASISTVLTLAAMAIYIMFTSRSRNNVLRLTFAGIVIVALLVGFGWTLNRRSAALSTADMGTFLALASQSREYDVVGINSVTAATTIVSEQGYWGAGTGTIVPAFDAASSGGEAFDNLGAEGVLHRILYEMGVLGALLYILLFGRLLTLLYRKSKQLRLASRGPSLMLLSAAGVLIAYLTLSYKHYGFAQDATLQTFAFAFIGTALGAAQRAPAGLQYRAEVPTCNTWVAKIPVRPDLA